MTTPSVEPSTGDDFTLDDTLTAHVEPTQRGALVVTERAARRVAQRALMESPRSVYHPKVSVQALDDHGVELRSEFGMDYPDEPLSLVLGQVRRFASARVAEVLGRPVRLFDLVIDELAVAPAARRTR